MRKHFILGFILYVSTLLIIFILSTKHSKLELENSTVYKPTDTPLGVDGERVVVSLKDINSSPNSILPSYLISMCGAEPLDSHPTALPSWFKNASSILLEKGLVWPTPKIGLDDHVLLSNVQEYEARYAPMLATDPEAAIKLLEPLIRYEEDKFIARSSRAELAESAGNNYGIPKPEVYRKVISKIPHRYFAMMVGETLDLNPVTELADIALAESKNRSGKVQLVSLAYIAEKKELLLSSRELAASILANKLNINYSSGALDVTEWSRLANERYEEDSDSY